MALFQRRSAHLPVVDPTMGDPDAARLLDDLGRGDWRAIHEFLRRVDDPDALEFYVDLCGQWHDLQAWAGEWAEAEPRSYLPMLVRGAHAVQWAWLARGSALATDTSNTQFRLFRRRLRMAHSYLEEAVARHPHDPTAWSQLIPCGIGMGVGIDEVGRRFREAVARCRWHHGAHLGMFMQLCLKWGGSHDVMHQFAEEAAVAAPPETGLAVLAADAHLERWLYLNRTGDGREHLLRPETRAGLHAAADRSVRHPAYRRRPGWQHDHNTLALAFWLADEHAAAAEMFDVLGDQLTPGPWHHFEGEPARVFVRAREESYRKRAARSS